MSTIQELVDYYAKLLVLQYVGKPRAFATIQATVAPFLLPQTTTQAISFSAVAASGQFQLQYGISGAHTSLLNWNDSAGTIQTALQAISGLSSVTVSGSIASQTLTVTFTGVAPPAKLLYAIRNSLLDGGSAAITISIAETDTETLPIAVMNGFEIGSAVGSQLDIIGKYVGVTRSGNGFSGPITLDDNDFTSLIRVAIIRNMAGSSLATIQALLFRFFPGQLFVFDHADMQMSYLMSSSVGSQDLAQLFVEENLLPRPMGVELASLIYLPTLSIFGMRSYDDSPADWDSLTTYSFGDEVTESGIIYESLQNNNLNNLVTDTAFWRVVIYPLNSYDDYESWHFLSYDDAIVI